MSKKTYEDSCRKAYEMSQKGELTKAQMRAALSAGGFPAKRGGLKWGDSQLLSAIAKGNPVKPTVEAKRIAAAIEGTTPPVTEPTPAELKALAEAKPRAAKRLVEPGTLRWEDVPEDIRQDIKADIVAHLLRASGYGGGK